MAESLGAIIVVPTAAASSLGWLSNEIDNGGYK